MIDEELDLLNDDESDETSEGEFVAEGDGEEEAFNASADGDDAGSEESNANLEGTELDAFEAADIEDVEVLTEEQIRSVVESVLFATDKPISIAVIKQAFKGTQVRAKDIREALTSLQTEYNDSARGFTLDEIAGGFQLRTKPDNMKYLRQSVKARPFKVSGPALETLSIVAYKQPVTKAQIDEIRGVESGHLLRALMEKSLLTFGERSELPGKPMYYETTRKFLEIFGLRNLQELPSLHEIDQLIPEGIGEVEDKETLSDLTEGLSQEIGSTYSEGEDELLKITDELSQISTSSEFFEKEKQRMRDKRDEERAQNIREALTVGEQVDEKDVKWLERYEKGQLEQAQAEKEVQFVTDENPAAVAESEEAPEEPSHDVEL
jgi:segregation and condensation protein B